MLCGFQERNRQCFRVANVSPVTRMKRFLIADHGTVYQCSPKFLNTLFAIGFWFNSIKWRQSRSPLLLRDPTLELNVIFFLLGISLEQRGMCEAQSVKEEWWAHLDVLTSCTVKYRQEYLTLPGVQSNLIAVSENYFFFKRASPLGIPEIQGINVGADWGLLSLRRWARLVSRSLFIDHNGCDFCEE